MVALDENLMGQSDYNVKFSGNPYSSCADISVWTKLVHHTTNPDHPYSNAASMAKNLLLPTIWSKIKLLSSGVWWVNAWRVTSNLQKGVVDSFHPLEHTHRPHNGWQEDVQGWTDEVAVPDSTDRCDSSGGSQISYFYPDQWISWNAVNSTLCSQHHCPYWLRPFPCRWKSWVGDKERDKLSVL